MAKFHELGYDDNIHAICILNDGILTFTVRKVNRLFKPAQWCLSIELKNIVTSKEYGIAYYDTLQEGIDIGLDFVKRSFPYVTKYDEIAE